MQSVDQKQDTDIMQDLRIFFNILRLLISFFSRPTEAFIRSRFGERYFSPFPVIATAIIINIWVIFWAEKNPITGEAITPLGIMIFTTLFVAFSVYHRLVITKGNVKGNYEVYSYFSGNSWGIWHRIFKHNSLLNRLFPFFINRVVEPVFVFIVGSVILFIDPAVGAFIQFSAACFLVQEAINYRYVRMHFLDMKDARLLAKHNANIDEIFNQRPQERSETAEIPHQVSPV